MVGLHGSDHVGPSTLAIGTFLLITALVALCAKHSGRVKRSPTHLPISTTNKPESNPNLPGTAPKSPRAYNLIPKQLVASIGNKGPIPSPKKKEANIMSTAHREGKVCEPSEGFGEGGVWQRSILMGEKCRPPEFSGAIYYDSQGNQLAELTPRSPRTGPLPNQFSVAIEKESQ